MQQLQPPEARGLAGLRQADAKVGTPGTIYQCGTQPARGLRFLLPRADGLGPSNRGGSFGVSAQGWPVFNCAAGQAPYQTTSILIYSSP